MPSDRPSDSNSSQDIADPSASGKIAATAADVVLFMHLSAIVVANLLFVAINLSWALGVTSYDIDRPMLIFPSVMLGCTANVVCSLALIRRRRWGFWGLLGSTSFGVGTNIAIGSGNTTIVAGTLSILVTIALLMIGKPNSIWSRLR